MFEFYSDQLLCNCNHIVQMCSVLLPWLASACGGQWVPPVADGGGGRGAVVVEEWWENSGGGGGRTVVGKHTVFRSAGERTVVVVVVREQGRAAGHRGRSGCA